MHERESQFIHLRELAIPFYGSLNANANHLDHFCPKCWKESKFRLNKSTEESDLGKMPF